MLRFIFALWAAKFTALVFRLKGDARDDWPGLLAFKLCPDFLARVAKPKLVIAVTGTNGKTTTSIQINDLLVRKGYKVSFNDWGANLHAGFALNLMNGVNIFNRCRVDASVLEADEKTLGFTMPMVEPDYIIVTNICKDSLRRNGHTEYIFDCINSAFVALGAKTTAILNADDPISSELARGTGAKRLFFGMADIGAEPFESRAREICVCPRCGGDIKYNYRFYRHIGDFYCDKCDFAAPGAEWFAEKVDLAGRSMTIREADGSRFTYPLFSDTVFNAFNVLSAVAMFRILDFSREEIAEFFASQKVPEIRETCVEFNGIEYYTYGAKGQNSSAASIVFEYLAKEPATKELVFCFDELQDRNHPPETVSWLYETDYEYLTDPKFKKIIVSGHMYLNHKLRLLLAGVPAERIVCVEDEKDVPAAVDREGFEKLYVLFEIDNVTRSRDLRDAIVAYAKERYADEKN